MSAHYHIEIARGRAIDVRPAGTATAAMVDLRAIRDSIDESWSPIDTVSIWSEAGSRRVCIYEFSGNEETVDWSEGWNTMPNALRVEWGRLLRAIRCYIGLRRALDLLHRLHVDRDNGGVLVEEDLYDEGLHHGGTKSRPGYYPRSGRDLLDSLEVYQGVYGAGLVQKIPRYDTQNYHYIRYWLYDLTEVTLDGQETVAPL